MSLIITRNLKNSELDSRNSRAHDDLLGRNKPGARVSVELRTRPIVGKVLQYGGRPIVEYTPTTRTRFTGTLLKQNGYKWDIKSDSGEIYKDVSEADFDMIDNSRATDACAADAKFKVGDKVWLRGQGGGVCTIIRIGPKPAMGKLGSEWAKETFEVRRDADGVIFKGLVDTYLRLANSAADACDAADETEKIAQDSAIVALFQPLADAQAELRDGNKKSNAKNVLAAAIAAAEKEFKGNPFSSRDKRIIDDAKKVLAQFDAAELNNDADLRAALSKMADIAKRLTDAKVSFSVSHFAT